MRASKFLITTKKEIPSDAEIVSHQLMLRAGMIRKLASGLYTWLPIGLRVLRKVEAIIKEEMDKTGAQEILMPVIQPAELWSESGRWEQYGPELLRVKDRHNRSFCLGPTHEEVVADLTRNEIHSYKQLPIIFYQIQTKFRDEVRPRFGVMRSREFLMKDAYSFHASEDSLHQTYELMHAAYTNIFNRIGLDFRSVQADTGSIGGDRSHEFHVLAESGEDAIAFSTESNFAANIEMTKAIHRDTASSIGKEELQEIRTLDQHNAEKAGKFLGVDKAKIIRTLIVLGEPVKQLSDNTKNDKPSPLVALVLRGDHELNTIKAEKISGIKSPLTFASKEIIKEQLGRDIDSLGPVGLTIPVIADYAASDLTDFSCAANKDGVRLTGVNWGRDCHIEKSEDIRNVIQGDLSPDGEGTLNIKRGIEIGHIFQLGTKYSEAMDVTILNEEGKKQPMFMGCYGIGISRIVAATIEQNNDDKGVLWPDALAPFQIALIPINLHKSQQVKKVCEQLYAELLDLGFDVLFMDQEKARLGGMLADVELMGLPHRIVIGEKGLAREVAEYRNRKHSENKDIPLEGLTQFLLQNIL
jgi:prolyl-tRNA synthetase